MKRLSSFVIAAATTLATVAQISGKWTGDLSVQGMRLPLVFSFSETVSPDSLPACTMDSPAQNAFGIPAEVSLCSPDSVVLGIPRLGVAFAGSVSGDTISGTFRQGLASLPLRLVRSRVSQPREPEAKPYTEREVTIMTPDSVLLSATLTIPSDAIAAKRVPVAVLVSGSGPQNRDEEVFGLKPFAVLADSLARAGIATVRYDDRGTAKSGGDFASSTTHTFASDADAVLHFARNLDFCACAGIIGHSEGGLIAFMLGATSDPDFIIALAGPGLKGSEVLTAQNLRALRKAGFRHDEVEPLTPVIRELFAQTALTGKLADGAAIADSLGIAVPPAIAAEMRGQKGAPAGPWLTEFLATDPAPYIRDIKCPALALNGSLDTQVEAGSNIAAIAAANPSVETHLLPGLNHLFQKASSGDITEYASLGTPFQGVSIQLIIGFILRNCHN